MSETQLDPEVQPDGVGASPEPEEHREPEVTVEDLRKLLEQQKTHIAELQARERAARQDAETARGSAVSEAEARYDSEVHGIESKLAARGSEADALEDAYARHIEAGEWKPAAAVQRKIAAAEADLHQLRQSQEWFKTNKQAWLSTVKQSAPAERGGPQVGSDGFTERERSWIADHPQYARDPEFRENVADAHVAAIRRRLPRDSNEYFDFVNGRLGLDEAEPKQQPRKAAANGGGAAAAPVTRRATGEGTGNRVVARLDDNERATADWMFPNDPPEQRYVKYAQGKALKKSQGYYQ